MSETTTKLLDPRRWTTSKENTMCTICKTESDSFTIGSDGRSTACADCMGNAADE